MAQSPPRVAIVGGGIGGLFAANALVAQGISRFRSTNRRLRSARSAPACSSRRTACAICNGSDWSRRWRNGARGSARNSHYFRHDGAPIAPVQVTDSSGWNATFGMHRADLVDMLAAALPSGTVHTGHRCSGFEQDGDTARVSFANGAIGGSRHRHRRRRHPLRASAACVSTVAAGLPRLGRLSRAGAA